MKTVGSILKKARSEKGIDYKTVFRDTKIPPKFLRALEEARWEEFSSRVHITGFLKNYAQYLELNVDEVLAFFRREYKSDNKNGREQQPFATAIESPSLVITPALVITVVTVTLIIAFLGYIFVQYRSFAGAPTLIIDQPQKEETTTIPTFVVHGQTDYDAEVFINGQAVIVDQSGSFETTITLAPGVNTLNFEAVNKLGKSRKETATIVFEKEEIKEPKPQGDVAATESAKPQEESTLTITVDIGPNSAWLNVMTDNKEAFEGIIVTGGSREFQAQEKIVVRTGNGGSTTVIVNDKKEVLGREGEVVEKEFKKET